MKIKLYLIIGIIFAAVWGCSETPEPHVMRIDEKIEFLVVRSREDGNWFLLTGPRSSVFRIEMIEPVEDSNDVVVKIIRSLGVDADLDGDGVAELSRELEGVLVKLGNKKDIKKRFLEVDSTYEK